jgi:transglutaminase-like putative cysteine protease
MSFARDKRLLLGLLALLAPLPLPFNEVLAWPVLGAYAALLVVFLRRAWRDPGSWLPPWAMNVLGLLYLPVLYLDLVVLWGGQLVRPVIHLAMFAVAVKLYAMRHERDKWHIFGGCFFLFLAAMGTSVHPAMMLYLLAVVGLVLVILTRFSYFSVLARFGYRDGDLARVPLRGFVAASLLGVMLVGIPLFAVLPRIRTPYLLVRGAGSGTLIGSAGFSDLITLDAIGSARGNREVLLRLRFAPQEEPRQEIRLKAATYERYDGRTWRASGEGTPVVAGPGGTFTLGPGATRQRAEVWLLPWASTSLPLPVQAVGLQVARVGALGRDRGGATKLLFMPPTTLRYDVDLADEPVFDGLAPPRLDDPQEPALQAEGATPRVAALAAEVMGEGSALARVQRLEQHLAGTYRYSTEFVGRSGQLPLERFLFEERRGHCEFFATAMVVMLRSQGIPARFVTGFLGGEPSNFEGYYIVRQGNAHAWVEAWVPEVGWQLFDPTPPGGRPGIGEGGLAAVMGQVWDYVLFRWDRYVLTFGVYDQIQLFMQARGLWMSLWKLFERDEEAGTPAPEVTLEVSGDTETAAGTAGSGWRDWVPWLGGLLLVAALCALVWWRWRIARRRRTATDSYRRLRDRLERGGLRVPPSLAPLHLAASAATRFPQAGAPTGRLVQLYLRESFAGETLSEAELALAADALRAVDRLLAKAS